MFQGQSRTNGHIPSPSASPESQIPAAFHLLGWWGWAEWEERLEQGRVPKLNGLAPTQCGKEKIPPQKRGAKTTTASNCSSSSPKCLSIGLKMKVTALKPTKTQTLQFPPPCFSLHPLRSPGLRQDLTGATSPRPHAEKAVGMAQQEATPPRPPAGASTPLGESSAQTILGALFPLKKDDTCSLKPYQELLLRLSSAALVLKSSPLASIQSCLQRDLGQTLTFPSLIFHICKMQACYVPQVLCKGQGKEGPFSKCGLGQTIYIRITGRRGRG